MSLTNDKLNMMKKLFFDFSSLFMLVLVCMMALSVTSCDTDEDTARINAQPCVYVSTSTLKFFNVKYTDDFGNETVLTTKNTKVVSNPTLGFNAAKIKETTKSLSDYKDELRVFTGDKMGWNRFPASYAFKVSASPKQNVVPAKDEKPCYVILLDMDMNSNGETWNGKNKWKTSKALLGINDWESFVGSIASSWTSATLTTVFSSNNSFSLSIDNVID